MYIYFKGFSLLDRLSFNLDFSIEMNNIFLTFYALFIILLRFRKKKIIFALRVTFV